MKDYLPSSSILSMILPVDDLQVEIDVYIAI